MHTQNKSTAAGHTKGPWMVAHSPIYGTPYVIDATANLSLTGNIGPKNFDTAEANARLIAAAPGLLWALEAICARIHGDFDHPALAAFGPLLNTEADIMSIASTALARAKGVQS